MISFISKLLQLLKLHDTQIPNVRTTNSKNNWQHYYMKTHFTYIFLAEVEVIIFVFSTCNFIWQNFIASFCILQLSQAFCCILYDIRWLLVALLCQFLLVTASHPHFSILKLRILCCCGSAHFATKWCDKFLQSIFKICVIYSVMIIFIWNDVLLFIWKYNKAKLVVVLNTEYISSSSVGSGSN